MYENIIIKIRFSNKGTFLLFALLHRAG